MTPASAAREELAHLALGADRQHLAGVPGADHPGATRVDPSRLLPRSSWPCSSGPVSNRTVGSTDLVCRRPFRAVPPGRNWHTIRDGDGPAHRPAGHRRPRDAAPPPCAGPGRGGRGWTGRRGARVEIHRDGDLDAVIASGSYELSGTAVLPCSASGTLGALSHRHRAYLDPPRQRGCPEGGMTAAVQPTPMSGD
jgi:hypothetical protein